VLCDTGPGFRSDEARQRWNDYAIGQAGRLERDGLAAFGESPETRDAGAPVGRGPGTLRARHSHPAGRERHRVAAVDHRPGPGAGGARDQAFLAAAEYMAAKIPGAVHAVIPDAGHACNFDQPELFNRQVLAFLQRRDLR